MKPIPHSRPSIGPAEKAAVLRVLSSGQLAEGPEASSLEAEGARLCGARFGAAVSSGTEALELSLRALGVGPGDDVLIPSFVCSALWHAVVRCGAAPVLVDSEEGGFNASMKDAARKRTRRTKALILPHLFGMPADVDGARRLGVPVIEDLAQAIGARRGGKPLGSFGAASVVSFYATKLAGAGEGGLVASSDRRLIERVRDLREYDEKTPREGHRNAKLSDVHAALARAQLRRLPSFLAERERIARAYDAALETLPVGLPPRTSGRVYFRYVPRLREAAVARWSARLAREGVAARRPVWRPLHRDVPAKGEFPNAERAWALSLSIPIYPSLTPSELGRVVAALRKAAKT